MSSPSSGLLPKALAIGGALLGLSLMSGERHHAAIHASKHVHHMVEDDYMHHLLHSMEDYSPYPWLNRLKHWLFHPANTHFIRRPLIHLQSYLGLVWDNLLPISLMTVGLTYAFNGTLIGVARTVGNALFKTAKGIGTGFAQLGKALWTLSEPFRQNITFKIPQLSPKGIVAVATGLGLLGYGMHKFKREITEENQLDTFNVLRPPGH